MRAAGMQVVTATTVPGPWPDCKGVDAIVQMAKRTGVQAVVAVGGGGTIDMAKAVSAVTVAKQPCAEWLLGASRIADADVGTGVDEEARAAAAPAALPVLAVPTTVAGGLAAASRRCVVHEPGEMVLTAPLFSVSRDRCRAAPTREQGGVLPPPPTPHSAHTPHS